jgi:2'-5' RNA ligase
MSLAANLISLIGEEHSNALVQYTLSEPIASKVRELRNMFSKDQLDPNENEAQDLDPHVTIFYGLQDEDLSDVKECLKNFGTAGFTIKSKPTIFDNPKHDVLILPVESACFGQLHKHISNWCGKVPPTFREYKPHCTIAYLKKGTPYKHISLPKDYQGTTNEVEFSDTKDNSHKIQLG